MMTPTAGRIASLSLLVSAAAAQSGADVLSSLSETCQQAAGSLVGGEFAQCADMLNLINIISAEGSIVQPVNVWANSLCAKEPCADDVVADASSRVQDGCGADIQDGNVAAFALQTITTNFNDVKGLVCLQSSDNSTSCVTNFLTSVEKDTGKQLTTDQLQSIANVQALQGILGQLPQGDLCTDCNAALLNNVQGTAVLTQDQTGQLVQLSQGECGSDFGTSMPSTVEDASEGSASRLSTSAASALALAALAALAL